MSIECDNLIESYQNYVLEHTFQDTEMEVGVLQYYIDSFTIHIKDNPLAYNIYYWRGLCYSELKCYKEAMQDFKPSSFY